MLSPNQPHLLLRKTTIAAFAVINHFLEHATKKLLIIAISRYPEMIPATNLGSEPLSHESQGLRSAID